MPVTRLYMIKGTVKNNNFEIPDAFLFLLPLHEEFEEPEILK